MTTASPDTPAIACHGLSVTFDGRSVLDGVDLDLLRGEWLGLIGPNGAGKSTVLRAIARLVDHGGRVALADARHPGPRDVALVPQNPTVPAGMTVSEYVLVGRTAHLGWLARESAHDRRVVSSALHRLDLASFADRSMTALSGGEMQRVVIARALAQETPVLLLDEPTSALDVGHQAGVLELVDDLRRSDGLSVLAVMHDLTTAARFADRLALLDRGRLVTVGSPAQVLDAERLSGVYGTALTVRVIDGELVVLPAPRAGAARPAVGFGTAS
ncbi:MAG: ABC transporter ATP-binding protein [Acidimicrobiales bacterium]